MTPVAVPGHLELLLSDEPVLDLYWAGPWRVPDGLAEGIYQQARLLAATDRARALNVTLPERFRPDATAVAADLFGLTSFLCGVSAVRGGSRALIEYELFDRFEIDAPVPDRDPLQWVTYATAWRPPGSWLMADPARRAAGLALTGECLRLLEGLTPVRERVLALSGLHRRFTEQVTGRPQLRQAGIAELQAACAKAATAEELAVLPELSGPEGYLAWAYEGFGAAHGRLAASVPGTAVLEQAVAELVLQAGLTALPGALAVAAGTGGYLAVQDRLAGAGGFAPGAWREQVRVWLARGLAAGEIAACRGWLDMAVRLTGILQGLPGEADRPSPCYVPVTGFQHDVRALARPRRVPNPLTAALARQPGTDRAAGDSGEAGKGGEAGDRAGDPMAELAALPGLDPVRGELEAVLAVARAERARRDAGVRVRPGWRNLVFAGGPGTGKSRVAAILGRALRDAGVLSAGTLTEVTRADLAGDYLSETRRLCELAFDRARGGVLLISSAHQPGAAASQDRHAIRLIDDRAAIQAVWQELTVQITDSGLVPATWLDFPSK